VLRGFSWPGNVRQLRNAIEYALVLSKAQTINPDDLPADVRDCQCASVPSVGLDPPHSERSEVPQSNVEASAVIPSNAGGLKQSVQSAEADAIRATLHRLHWRMTAAALKLKISRSTLYQRMELYKIKRPE
jgi:DNA-binding NtrC family response regulator